MFDEISVIDGASYLPRVGVWALILLRMQGLAWTAPCWTAPGLDWRFRGSLGLLVGAVLIPVVEPRSNWPMSPSAVGWSMLTELLVGCLLGWSAALVIAGARQAGELVASQAGLSVVSWFDPDSGESLTPIGHLYALLASVAFLALDGPLVLVRAMIESFQEMPAGRALPIEELSTQLFGRVARGLEISIQAAAPAAVSIALVGLVMAWLARAAPASPFAALSLPIRSMVGILLTALGMAALVATFVAVWQSFPGMS